MTRGETDRGVPFVEAQRVSKRYGGAQALNEASVIIERARVHALVGENGAGKSTLGKILSGLVAPTSGTLVVDGEPTNRLSPREAIRHGITIIEQELTLLSQHSVADNVFLGIESHRRGWLRSGALRDRFAELQQRVGFDLPADARVAELRVADRQKVEILRALARDARMIIMDEPTAALTRDEAGRLLRVIGSLRDAGTAVVFVSHNISDVLSIADTLTILKDGRVVRSGAAATETTDSIVTGMLGRSLGSSFPLRPDPPPSSAPVVLSARGVSRGNAIRDINLEIAAGEIVGLAGLVGSGRSEVARAISGADPITAGDLRMNGDPYRPGSIRQAMRRGIALVPESRKDEGLLMGQSVARNLTAASLPSLARVGFMTRRRESRRVEEYVKRLDIRPASGQTPVALLSGGNQQKVLFGKWLMRTPVLLIADEPTRGVDVGARRAIYDLIVDLAAQGTAVLLISSELEEVMHLSHRILVMRSGQIAGEFAGDATEDELMRAALIADPVAIDAGAAASGRNP